LCVFVPCLILMHCFVFLFLVQSLKPSCLSCHWSCNPLKTLNLHILVWWQNPRKGCALVASLYIMMMFFFLFLFVMEPNHELVDPILSQENITLTKKQKKAYELNMHF
jgi:hypothetical protein